MKFKFALITGVFSVALFGVLLLSGCCQKSEPRPQAGPAEKAGFALDNAMDKTGDAAKKMIDKANADAKEAASKAVEKTGEILEKAGAAIEKSGVDVQNSNNNGTNP